MEPRAAGAPEGQEPRGHRVSLPPSVFKNRVNAPGLDPEPRLENRVAPCSILAGAYEVVLLRVAGLVGPQGREEGWRARAALHGGEGGCLCQRLRPGVLARASGSEPRARV